MTREKAINYLERCADGLYPDYDNAISLAITSLRAQQEAEKNEALTLEELREMDGEPAWIVTQNEFGLEPLVMCVLVEVQEESVWLTNNLVGRTEYAADIELEEDGITVYRRKPEEG